MRPTTDEELGTLPYVIFTSDVTWDPTVYDDDDVGWHDCIEFGTEENEKFTIFEDGLEDYFDCEEESGNETDSLIDALLTDHEKNVNVCVMNVKVKSDADSEKASGYKEKFCPKTVLPKRPDYQALRPYFAWATVDRIKQTIRNTTQWFRAENRIPMRRHYKSRFPAAHARRLNEKVATDTFFSEIAALDDGIPGHGGCKTMQLFVGIDSRLTECIPMKEDSKASFPEAFKEFIRKWGAPKALLSDNAMEQNSADVFAILRDLNIEHWTSEPHQQNQNPAERRIQDVKKAVEGTMDRTGTPADLWLLCTLYVASVFNILSNEKLNGMSAIEKATGFTPDISAHLAFRWWEPVYYLDDGDTFPASREKLGRFVGIAEDVGDILTFRILTEDTRKVIVRSCVRSATDPHTQNLRALGPTVTPEVGEKKVSFKEKPFHLASFNEITSPLKEPSKAQLPQFSPDDLIGKTFLKDINDGEKVSAEVVRKINDLDSQNHENIKFLLKYGDGDAEEVMAYQELCDYVTAVIEDDMANPDRPFIYKGILDHEGPLTSASQNWKGSLYNVRVEWEDGSITMEPLSTFIKDDPLTAAVYAKDHGLLETRGWTQLKKYARRGKKLKRMVKQVKRARESRGPVFKFGVQIPQNSKEARRLQDRQGHTKWTDAEKAEIDQLHEYETFKDIGKGTDPPDGYKKIRVRMVYDCKHDLRYKARLVAGGHLTDPVKDAAYAGVVSLRAMRMTMLAGELNGLKPMVGDIGNAYLESYTREKVCFVAGPEFGELEGHTMLIVKAIYGLRSSGSEFHQVLADVLRAEGFVPSANDNDAWYRDAGDCYEYVCVYVDDLMAILKEPAKFFELLTSKYKFKLKGVGEPSYHLGGNFGRDPDGTLYWGAKTYIEKMMANYERWFGSLPRKQSSPLKEGDSPELDTTELLDNVGVKRYQSMVGALQWCITLGRFDCAVAVMTMSRFRVAPRVGHLERLKHIYGYLRRRNNAAIRFRTDVPRNESIFTEEKYDWSRSIYDTEPEVNFNPGLYPEPKGKTMRLTTFVDANLMHCKVTGKSCTGILHMLNNTPIEWYSKMQDTVETATYGSEFVAARIATDQIVDIRDSLAALGVRLDDSAWMLGDSKSVVTSATIPFSMLKKRHQFLNYHRVRAAVAMGIIKFIHIKGTENPADVMTKFLPWSVMNKHVEPLLFQRGITEMS